LLLLLLLGVVVGWGVASDRPPRGVEDWCARRGVGDSGREGGIGRGAHCLAFGTALLGDGLAGCFGDGGQVVLLLLCWACLLLLHVVLAAPVVAATSFSPGLIQIGVHAREVAFAAVAGEVAASLTGCLTEAHGYGGASFF